MIAVEPRHYDVIIAPVITEKATLASDRNQVMFKVPRHATKTEIKVDFEIAVQNVATNNMGADSACHETVARAFGSS